MDPLVLILVLVAAALHAAWNALVKVAGDALVRLAMFFAFSVVLCLPLVAYVGLPDRASWPWLVGSVVIHQLYFVFLVKSYRTGDLSTVYPIARGVAPMLVAAGGWLVAGEVLDPLAWVAIGILSAGVLAIAAGASLSRTKRASIAYALGTGITIACYSVIDGIGGRRAGNILAYVGCLFVLQGLPLIGFALLQRRGQLTAMLKSSWRLGLVGGTFSFAAYGLVIWAMSITPMSYVSALRETSVLIAAFIGTRMLGEPFGARRMLAAGAVAVGVALLQISR